MYCLWDAIELFLRAELHAGIYDCRHNLGKQSICQHKYSELFQQSAIWAQDGNGPGEQLEQGPFLDPEKAIISFHWATVLKPDKWQSLADGSGVLYSYVDYRNGREF